MLTPPAATTDVSPRHSRTAHSTYERVLGVGLAAALAVVSGLALWSTSSSTASIDVDRPSVASGQHARGKATVPSTSTGDRAADDSSQL